MECPYLRNVHDQMAEGTTAHEKICGVTFDGPLIPFVAKVSHKPISSKGDGRLHQFGNKMLPRVFLGSVPCGRRMVRRFAHRGLRASTKKSHHKEKRCFHVQSDLSNSTIFSNLHAENCPPAETLTNTQLVTLSIANTKYIAHRCTTRMKQLSFQRNTSR